MRDDADTTTESEHAVRGASATGAPEDDATGRAYLAQVMEEIDDEVRRRRTADDLPAELERHLDQLFAQHAPMGAHGTGLRNVLRLVDNAVFIDPVVPVESRRPGGTAVKRGLRSLNFWYLRFITHQVSEFATAVSRALHVVDARLTELTHAIDAMDVPLAPVVIDETAPDRGAPWWQAAALEAVEAGAGRVCHAACGDGWLVGALGDRGVDAYGVDPRPSERSDRATIDLREEDVMAHLAAVAPGTLSGIVLSGLFEATEYGIRRRLLDRALRCLSEDGTVVVHSLSPAAWAAADAPFEADTTAARPYRPATWAQVLGDFGVGATLTDGPGGRDYLVVGRRGVGSGRAGR